MEFEEPFQVFLRKIKSLGSEFTPKAEASESSRKVLTNASSKAKKWEEEVKKKLVDSIKEIDKKISNYEYVTSKNEVEKELHDVIQVCLDELKKHMKDTNCTEEKKNEEKNAKKEEFWVATAVEDVEEEFVTDPYMRYNNLGPILQRCLLSLCVFSCEVVITKRSIIYLWIGEGFVKPTKDRSVEQVGQGYFQMLLSSGLVLPIKKKHDKTARGCILPQNVWQMLKSQAEASGLFKFYSEDELVTNKANIEYCPLTCCAGTQGKEQQVVTCLEERTNQLLTLFNSSAQYLDCEKSQFQKLKSIKVLQLGKWRSLAQYSIEVADGKFLDSLQVMENLTYLGLEGISGISSLDLKKRTSSNLCILNLRACHHLENLSDGITSLKRLTHLDVSECPLIDKMPKGLQNLVELQVLKGFIICKEKDSCQLQDLVGLKKLRKLSITIARHVDANHHLRMLKDFTSLHSLTITWGQGPKEPLFWSSESIEKLDIRRVLYPFLLAEISPRQFPNLRKLYITGGKLKKQVLKPRSKWKVETLRLKFLSELEWDAWSQLEETFPLLACVEICECPKLKANPHALSPNDIGKWIEENGYDQVDKKEQIFIYRKVEAENHDEQI